jgi:hypothetical protein
MTRVFDSGEYRVYVNGDIMVFKPSNASARVLILTPPGIKPQFYSLLAVLLAKSGIESIIPKSPLPCNEHGLRNLVTRLINNHKPNLVVALGFNVDYVYGPRLTIGFDEGAGTMQLLSSQVPGSIYMVSDQCGQVGRALVNADFIIKGALTLDSIIKIRDLILSSIPLDASKE